MIGIMIQSLYIFKELLRSSLCRLLLKSMGSSCMVSLMVLKLYDARIPELLVCTMRPHVQKVEKVVGIGFQPGLDSGDIQFTDIEIEDRYLTIDAHRGSLTALAVHRHAPILASGSAKQLIKVFSLDGDQLGTIRYHQQACFHCWWNQT
ncbi:hypothetical protein IC575_000620 [Cucumis melo]